MILREEKQRQVHMGLTEVSDNTTFQIRVQEGRKDVAYRVGPKRRGRIDKKQLYYDNCSKIGQMRETCFKIHGVPKWYKELVDQRKKECSGVGK